ncbi:ABC transporter permease [Candidatus Dependentiae bacterium]
MTFVFLLRVAFRALFHHKGRSILTLLGIIIGTGGIITITAIGSGAQKKAREQMLAYGSKQLRLMRGNFRIQSPKPSKPLTLQHVEIIKQQCNKIQYISPVIYADNPKIEYQGKKMAVDISGVGKDMLGILERDIQQGVFFSKEDINRKEKIVVLEPKTAEAIFKWTNPIGKIIRINEVPFTVVGVLSPPKMEKKWDIGRLKVYVPFSVLNLNKIYRICFVPYKRNDNMEINRQVGKIMRSLHNLEKDEPDDFMIDDVQMMAQAAEGGARVIALFALIAASIALFVGGIGVMNIMLVAVKERTKEIGIKMALGATSNIIRTQFLVEAMALCSFGGICGIFIGIAVSLILSYFTSLASIIEFLPILVSFLVTVLIGIFFGFYPAYKASKLNPIEALLEQ